MTTVWRRLMWTAAIVVLWPLLASAALLYLFIPSAPSVWVVALLCTVPIVAALASIVLWLRSRQTPPWSWRDAASIGIVLLIGVPMWFAFYLASNLYLYQI